MDKIKLSKIKVDTNKKGFVFLKPKGWKHTIKIRKNFIDKEVVYYVLQDLYHLPPSSSKISDNSIILDLGSNIGLTIAHMKHLYPGAKIIGYEMNQQNFLLAKRNIKFYDNVVIYNKAVWCEDGLVSYKKSSNFDAYAIIDNNDDLNIDEVIEVQSMSMNSVIKDNKLTHIDYLKMDIEGAEKAILESEDLSWMDIVYMMNIEMHSITEEDEFNKFLKIIESKGFCAWKDNKHWSSIFAVRNIL
ncbi:hypothetical protein BIW12_03155 [Flavobacterium commune]|uniref:Methyltransferase FkbM domain-containing protein n=2 Tax=Flavobacterium commune TaxID=1306519 RepID=A0A1D9P7H8_9FLAO|nr:hypothetical protein BIW12_03155 [Flavobacterium commune]